MKKKPIFSNEIGQFNVPLSNTMLKESLSSKQDSPRVKSSEGGRTKKEESKTLLQKKKDVLDRSKNTEKMIFNFCILLLYKNNIEIQNNKRVKETFEKTEPKLLSEMRIQDSPHSPPKSVAQPPEPPFSYHLDSPRTQPSSHLSHDSPRPLYKPPKYDISEIEHLFMDGQIPQEIHSIEDPMEYNYLLVKLKKEFNDKTRSEFLKYMGLQLPYNSRRDEVGGVITEDDWQDFITRVERMIRRVRKRRRRVIRRRKKKGKKLMPRKTLFKPKKRPNLAKDPLWREIFLDESSEDSTVEDTDIFEEDKFRVPEKKQKLKFFEKEDKFVLPELYKPLVKGTLNLLIVIETKNKTKEKEYTFKTRLKEQVVKPPVSPLRCAAKNSKIINESPAKGDFNLKFVRHGKNIFKNASK
jgi:hypothetical protein